jgi:hypothetical protein
VIITRRSEVTSLSSTITIYENMPWVDITNQRAEGPAIYRFEFALQDPAVSWEVPGGFADRAPGTGVDRLVHLRWLRLATGTDAILLRGIDAPVADITVDGSVVSHAPGPRARYRLGFASGYSAGDDPWRFGWNTEPLLTAGVPGTGQARLASYGSLFLVDQPGAGIIELRKEKTGEGVILFLQELVGSARDITIGPGVLVFRGAHRVDFLGRDLGELPLLAGGGVSVPVRAYGITAVRLTGVELAAR